MAVEDAGSAGLKVVKFAAWVIYAVLTFACIVLAFGFALLLFGADPSVGFANFVYESAGAFMDPFRGLIEPMQLGNGGLISWSALFAIAAYLVLMWIVSLVASAVSSAIYRRRRHSRSAVASVASAPAPMAGETPPESAETGPAEGTGTAQ